MLSSRRLLFLLFSIFWYTITFGQEEHVERIKISKKDSAYYPVELVLSFRDSTQKMNFSDVTKIHFTKNISNPKKGKGFYWYKFWLDPTVKAKNILISSYYSDQSSIHVPYKNEYKKYSAGILEKTSMPIIDRGFEASFFMFPTDSIDFSKPFYMVKKTISLDGIASRERVPEVAVTDYQNVATSIGVGKSTKLRLSFYLGMLLVSSLLFLVGLLVTGDKNYLIYCLYLVFTSAIFATDLPLVFNFLNDLNPLLYHFIAKVSTVIASGLYLYFALNLLEIKFNMPYIHSLGKLVLLSIAIFLVGFIVVLSINPYIEYTISVYKWFRIIFGCISFLLFLLISIKIKKNRIYIIVLIGSFLLIIGNILTIIFIDAFYFLNTVVAETLIFWGLINYANKINQKNSVALQYELKSERKLKEGLQQLDFAKSNFFANISHELRTPLALIATPVQEKLNREGLPEKERKEYELILRNNNQLTSLVDQLLDLSKLESGNLNLKITKTSIQNFLEMQLEPYKYAAESNQLKFESNFNILEEEAWIDRDVLQKILSNLFSNAIKYTETAGSIHGYFTVNLQKLTIRVKNSSEPFSQLQKEQLFNRFYQADEFREGAGIGLALVKELVDLHKGKITVENEDGGFVAFNVVLPCGTSSFSAKEIYEGNDVSTPLPKPSISIEDINRLEDVSLEEDGPMPLLLIVEDNKDLRAVLQETFKNEYRVIMATNGEEGVKKAIEQVPDLIISDVMMPKKNGVELTNALKNHELTSHVPVILLTAKAGDKNELIGINSGADDYITKPFNNTLLRSKMSNLLNIREKMRARYSQEVILKPKDIAVTPTDEIVLERIQSVLDRYLMESSFSTEDFAKELGFSRMQLHRKLKGLTGLSATEFIRSQRLKMAAQLLEKSDSTVSEVCYQTGFNNLSYFAKCFKEAYGVSPSVYSKKG